jgi:drug/metabolite transporter (DMT)-like permease
MAPDTNRGRSLLWLHIIVLIWGCTGIIGEMMKLSAWEIVFWRTVVGAVGIGMYLAFRGIKVRRTLPEVARYVGIGGIIGLHWCAFFGAIQLSNVSTGMVMISTTALFVAILSPLSRQTAWKVSEIVLSGSIILGVAFIFAFESIYIWGIVVGLLAAMLAAVFSMMNAKVVHRDNAAVVAFYELLGAMVVSAIGSIVVMKGIRPPSGMGQWGLVLVLGLLATSFALVVSIQVMKELTPFTVALTINLEPIYTIAFALWYFGSSEYMSTGFYAGAIIIVSALFVHAGLSSYRMVKKEPPH